MPATGEPSDPFEVIARLLVPYLGEAMARAALQVNRDKLGLRGRLLTNGDVERLLAELTPGLHVFIGHDRTARLLAEIRAALPGGER